MAEMIFERNAETESLAIERATDEAEREYYTEYYTELEENLNVSPRRRYPDASRGNP